VPARGGLAAVVSQRARALLGSVRGKGGGRSPASRERRQIQALKDRVAKLEAEVQELRRLNRRTAELADVVQELLVPAANRDDEKVRRLLDEYSDAV
jgi:cell division protein FtsB